MVSYNALLSFHLSIAYKEDRQELE